MKQPKRQKLRTKLTPSGRIRGRPVGNAETHIGDMPTDKRVSRYDETIWIVRAVAGVGRDGFSSDIAGEEKAHGHDIRVETVRRRLRKIRSVFSPKSA